MGYFINFFIIFNAFYSFADESKKCFSELKIANQHVMPCLPKVISQSDSNWCFLFTAFSLTQQHVCKSQSTTTNRDISLRGVIQAYNKRQLGVSVAGDTIPFDTGYHWKEGGQISDVLIAVSAEKKLVSDACAPSKDFLDWRNSLPHLDTDSEITPTEILKYHYNQYILDVKVRGLSPNLAQCNLENTAKMKSQASSLAKFASDMSKAAGSVETGDVAVFMDKVFVPEHCDSDKISLEKMTIKSLSPKNESDMKTTIEKNIQKNRMLGVNICAESLRRESGCSPHAIAIGGIRSKCCGTICTTEYKIFDSDSKLPVEEDGSSWISRESVIGGMMQMKKIQKNSSDLIDAEISKTNDEIRKTGKKAKKALSEALKNSASSTEIYKIMSDEKYQMEFDLERKLEKLQEKKKKLNILTWIE